MILYVDASAIVAIVGNEDMSPAVEAALDRDGVIAIVTDLAVIEPTADGLVLRERAPGISFETIRDATDAALIIPDDVPEMRLS